MHHIRASRRRTHLEVRRPAPGGVHCALAPLQAGPLWIPPGAEPMLEQIVGWPSKADRKEEKIMNGEGRHVLSPSQAMIVRCTARAWKPKLRGTLAPGRAKCVQKTPPQKKGNMPLLKRIIPILIMLLFLPKFPGIAETNATATQEQLSHIENQIEAVDTTISQLDLRIEKCAALEAFEIGPVYAAQENEYRLKSPFQSALDELVHRTRGRLTEYGECYFGLREQKLLGLADETGFLVQRTHRLAQDLEDLDARREELTADVLGFLGHFGTRRFVNWCVRS